MAARRPQALFLLTALWGSCDLLASAYQCRSDVSLGPGSTMPRKGIAVDDSTLQWCASQIPDEWPNLVGSPMTSIRLFKAWDATWTDSAREGMWNGLVEYVSSTNATVLIGAQIHCSEQEDLESWIWTKELLKRLQPQQIMGLAIGNELELLHHKDESHVSNECVSNIWERGYFWRMFQRFVGEFDALGFSSVPVTSVFTGYALSGNPFLEKPGEAPVNSFLRDASKLYGRRFAFTFNIYPYYSDQQLDQGTADQCTAALAAATCFEEHCFLPSQLRSAREKIKQLTGNTDDTMWIGETGWSSPMSQTNLHSRMKDCPAWGSTQTFQNYYRGFLQWDLNIGSGLQPPDHAFFFTMRDSMQFGHVEHFGLVAKCDDPACKVTSLDFQAGSYELYMGPVHTKCGDAHLYDGWVIGGEEHCRNLCTLHDDRCRFYSIWPHSHDNHHWCRLTSFCNLPQSSAPHVITTYKRLGLPPVPALRPGVTPQLIERGGDIGVSVTAGGSSTLPAIGLMLMLVAYAAAK